MKRSLLFFTIMFFCFVVNAQLNVKVGLTANLSLLKMKDYYYGGPGVDVNVKYLFAGKYGIGISSGFQHFFSKDWGEDYEDINFNIIPIRLSLTYYIGNGPLVPYVGVEIGHNITKLTYTYRYYVYNPYSYSYYEYEDEKYHHGRFGIAPVIGIQVNMGSLLALDINTKMNLIAKFDGATEQSATYAGLNIGLIVKLGEIKLLKKLIMKE
jgi:hypothetical protein